MTNESISVTDSIENCIVATVQYFVTHTSIGNLLRPIPIAIYECFWSRSKKFINCNSTMFIIDYAVFCDTFPKQITDEFLQCFPWRVAGSIIGAPNFGTLFYKGWKYTFKKVYFTNFKWKEAPCCALHQYWKSASVSLKRGCDRASNNAAKNGNLRKNALTLGRANRHRFY